MSPRRLSLVVSLALSGIFPVVSRADLVAHYKLDEASGVVHDTGAAPAADSSNSLKDPKNYAQPGVPAGTYGDITLSEDQAKNLKSSVHIPAGDGFNIGPAEKSKLNITGNFTFTGWFKLSKTDGYHILLATGAGSGNGWKVGVNEGSLLFTAAGVADVTTDAVSVDADKWYYLDVTVEGKDGERKINFFVNGKKVTSEALTADDIKPSDAKQMHLGMAENADDTPENLDGNMTDLRVYNTVLSEKEIKAAATGDTK
jgi:hypothetical protein